MNGPAPAHRRRRRALFTAWFLIPAIGVAHGETASKRPTRHSQPPRPALAAPDRTGSIAKEAAGTPGEAAARPGSPDASAAPEAPLAPIYLPAAPRSRVLACGERWHAMKMDGTTGDDSWRDFALKCLVAKDDPPR